VRVVVVGAGVIGLWCGRDLAAAGVDVVVVGPADRPAMSTPASAGWVVPVLSHPLSGPGLVADSVRQALRREAAFSFRGMSPSLARWMWQFVRSGTQAGFDDGLAATLALAGSCLEDYRALHDEGLDVELHQDGLLIVARTPDGLAKGQHLVDISARAGYDGKCESLDASAAVALEPALAAGLSGAVHTRDELHVHPGRLVAALRDAVQDKGVAVVDAPVSRIDAAAGGRWSVVTPGDRITADKVVLAAGYWSGELARSLGVRLPLASAAGVSVTATGPLPPGLPLKLVEANVAVTPFDGGVRLAGRFILGRPPTSVSSRQARRVVDAALPYLRAWQPVEVSSTHVGSRPVTPDSLPIIGELPGVRGVLAATGHGMLGLTLAPGTAAEVAHQVTTGGPSPVATPFAPDRFAVGGGT